MTPDPNIDTGLDPIVIPSTDGMTTKVVKGSLWTLAGQVAPLAVSLVATPFVIRYLGSTGYGLLILVGLIPTYLSFADFGMNIASTRFASEAFAEGNGPKEAGVIRTASLIALTTSVPIAAIIFIFSAQIIGIFNVPENLLPDASLALKFAAITFVVNFLNGILNTPQLTRLRMDLNTFINGGFSVLGLISVPIVLFFYREIALATFVLMTVSILKLGGNLIVSGHLLRDLFRRAKETVDTRSLLKFGAGVSVAGIAGILLANAEKGILAATVSAAALAHYSVAFTLASMMTMFSGAMVQSLLPAFSRLRQDGNVGHLDSLYLRGIRISMVWAIPVLAILSLIAKPFFSRWAGEDFGNNSALPFYVLLGGVAFNIVAYFPYTAIMASGRSDVLAKLYWIELAAYVALVWFLSSRFGAVGAAAAWSIRVIIDTLIQLALAKKLAGVSYPKRGLVPFLVAAIIMSFPFLANLYYGTLNLGVIIVTVFCLTAYSILVWKTIIEKEEISWLMQRITAKFVK